MHKTLNIAITISVCSHLLGFTFIQPYGGIGFKKTDNNLKIFFLGALFDQKEFYPYKEDNRTFIKGDRYFKGGNLAGIPFKNYPLKIPQPSDDFFYYSKQNRSLFDICIEKQKILFYPKQNIYLPRKDASLTFYPYLPYSFILYFKDRQKANLEFLFYIPKSKSLPYIKRKVSCANLEIDLMVMRYISRSLYLIKDTFPCDSWQNVKIELRKKDAED
jgi:hypothetical protein